MAKKALVIAWFILGIIVCLAMVFIFKELSDDTKKERDNATFTIKKANNQQAGISGALFKNQIILKLSSPLKNNQPLLLTCGNANEETLSKTIANRQLQKITMNLPISFAKQVQWCGIYQPTLDVPGKYLYFMPTDAVEKEGESIDASFKLNGKNLSVDLQEGPGEVLAEMFSGRQVRFMCSFEIEELLRVSSDKIITWPERQKQAMTVLPLDISQDVETCSVSLLSDNPTQRALNSTLAQME